MESLGDVVKIRVKSASHRCEDLEIACSLDSSIMHVKEIIKDQYPLHPEIKEQRIIYAGHLLEDAQILRDVFTQGSQVSVSGGYTFHLACNSQFLRKTTNSPSDGNEPRQEAVAAGRCNFPESVNNPPQGVPAAGIPQDMLALHQLYVEQMMNFMTQWNQGIIAPVWMPAPTPPVMQGIRMQQTPQMPIPAQANQQPPLVEPVIRNEPAVVPAVPRVQDEDEPQRDILDWIYTGSRLFLILSVVYFYSNFTRFLLVILFTALVMFAQRRRPGPGVLNILRAQPQPFVAEQPPAQRNVNEDPHPQEGEVVPNGIAERAEGEAEAEGVENERSPLSPPEELLPAQVQQQQRYFDIARTFVMTFVTSLIPEVNP